MKIKRIVVSQPEPQNEKSPYNDIKEKYGVELDFRPFIHVEGVSSKEFRQQKINITDHTAVIFTSKTAIDNFFRLSEELRISIPETMKYFCITEAIALYLQKYIVYRKRKIFFGDNTFKDLLEIIKKHKEENFLLPLSNVHKPEIPRALTRAKIKYTKGIFYKTVSSDLSDLNPFPYDMIVFYSPNGVKSLFENFPNFEQGDIAIAVFGDTTAKVAKDLGLRIDIKAPTEEFRSMTQALDFYLSQQKKKK
ncbi:uroporphyrinogen-III synthase [Tenuifilum thalassicum]|uniref:Uroporphyrinogen-III synthase n=1 Tax=Tenuifilum thalassicum TaxID=2590900 RepID=A0A7D4AYZ7_9BACT|nr:uroporphyrinogen-III synthase [Tenuifilum thalassicum]QKG81174.1 uroporphyrinogen-III synthase [Tenuifilum thalassicum]